MRLHACHTFPWYSTTRRQLFTERTPWVKCPDGMLRSNKVSALAALAGLPCGYPQIHDAMVASRWYSRHVKKPQDAGHESTTLSLSGFTESSKHQHEDTPRVQAYILLVCWNLPLHVQKFLATDLESPPFLKELPEIGPLVMA